MDKDKKIAISAAVHNARENFLLMSELWKVVANETKAKYDATLMRDSRKIRRFRCAVPKLVGKQPNA